MLSPAGKNQRTNNSIQVFGFRNLSNTVQLICLILLFIVSNSIFAQGASNLQIELVARTFDEEAIIHVRLPRGQMINSATLSQGDNTIVLAPDVDPLPITRFILIDASEATINLQQVLQSNMSRFWRAGEELTSLTFYNDEVTFFDPTSDTEINNNHLANYIIESGVPACHGDALSRINDITRDYERSWRILLVTAGDFSEQEQCNSQNLPILPSSLDLFTLAEPVDAGLEALVENSSGQQYQGNLLTIENEISTILTQWGQSTYALQGDIPDDWNSDESFEFDISLSNGEDENIVLTFQDYNVPLPATPTPVPTATVEIPTETPVQEIIVATEATEEAVVPVVTSTPGISDENGSPGSNGVAILLIIGAILFVVGAVVLALALSRVRRVPVDDAPQQTGNFYETLQTIDNEVENQVTATRIRERGLVSEADDSQTQIATSLDDTYMAEDDVESEEEHDELLLTQVLTDNRFQSMMEQSTSNEEVIGWMRLLVDGVGENRDFELSRRGAVIGRSQECDIQITGDRAISRQHARLDVRSNDQVTVSRLSAVNPVVVGGVQISNRHPLAPNDVIHLSDETRLIFVAKEEQNTDTEIQDE